MHVTQCKWMREIVQKHHTQLSVFFVLFSLILLQQVFCKMPANQIIISTFSQLLYNLVLKNHTDNVLGEVFLLNWVTRLQKLSSIWGALLQEFGVRVR